MKSRLWQPCDLHRKAPPARLCRLGRHFKHECLHSASNIAAASALWQRTNCTYVWDWTLKKIVVLNALRKRIGYSACSSKLLRSLRCTFFLPSINIIDVLVNGFIVVHETWICTFVNVAKFREYTFGGKTSWGYACHAYSLFLEKEKQKTSKW